jgi:hypothetical protein
MAVDEKLVRMLARLLPRDFRERVFEPAVADLRLDLLRSSPSGKRCAQLLFVFECLRLGGPQHVWRRGRPTRLGTAVVVALLVSALVIQRTHYRTMRVAAASEPAPANTPFTARER